MAILYHWSGEVSDIRPKNPIHGFSRAEIRALLGAVEIRFDSLFDGRLIAYSPESRGLPNVAATKLFKIGRGTGFAIMGDALVGYPGEIE